MEDASRRFSANLFARLEDQFAMAYIGSAEDARRIRKQEEEREKQRKEFEQRKQQGESNVDGAGLRKFGAGTTDVIFCLLEC